MSAVEARAAAGEAPSLSERRRLAALSFISAVLVILTFWMLIPPRFTDTTVTDYLGFYRPVALNIAAGRGVTTADGSLGSLYPPGYPLLLAGLFQIASATGLPQAHLLATMSVVCSGLTIVFVYLIASLVWTPRVALSAPFVAIFYPLNLALTLQPYSEVPALTLLFGGLYCGFSQLLREGIRYGTYLACGLLIGVSALIRPAHIAVLVPLGLVVYALGVPVPRRSKSMACIAMAAGYLIAVAPWELYVYAKTRQLIPLSTNGPPSIVDGLTFAVNPDAAFRTPVTLPDDVRSLQQDILDKRGQLQTASDIASMMAAELTTRPLAVARLYLIKMARSWFATDAGNMERVILPAQCIYLLVALISTSLAARGDRTHRVIAGAIWMLVFYFWLMTTIVLSICRYMIPASMLIALLMPALATTLRARYQNRLDDSSLATTVG
jgi:hypothetical protein